MGVQAQVKRTRRKPCPLWRESKWDARNRPTEHTLTLPPWSFDVATVSRRPGENWGVGFGRSDPSYYRTVAQAKMGAEDVLESTVWRVGCALGWEWIKP